MDDDSDVEDFSIVRSSKVNQRLVCLLHECYHDCLISDWQSAESRDLIHYLKKTQIFREVITLLREFI